MAQYFCVHPTHPQLRLIRQAAELVRRGGVIAYPTDSSYALGCRIADAEATRRLRAIREIDEKHHLTLVCRDLAEIGHYTRLDNWQFRLLKRAVPGSFTFLLPASREVPRRVQHLKRNTIGVRVPDHAVAQALLGELGAPLLSTTLILPGATLPLNDAQEIRARLEHAVDGILDAGACSLEPSTVVDLAVSPPVIVRNGRGHPALLGIG